jgi:2-iminobutanoate/2-iminopropanoate deaminase
MKKVICSQKAPGAIGPYSQAIEAGGMVFVSGQLPIDAATGVMAEGAEAQARQSLENITGTQSREGTEIMMNSLMDFTMAGILSKVLPIKDPGVTSGRNSMSAVYSSGLTKLRNGTARKMSLKVFEKGITAGLTASVHVTIFAAIRMCL